MEKRISKIFIIIISLALLLVPSLKLDASSGTIKVTSNRSQALVGSTVTVTVKISSSTELGSWIFNIDYDDTKLSLQSGDLRVVGYTDGKQKSQTYTYTFKVRASGTSTVSVKSTEAYDLYENQMSLSTSSVKIKGITQEELEASYSKNNNLSTLAVEGYNLSPEFNKDTLEYTVSVPSEVEKINLTGAVEDSASSVTGLGEFDVSEGDNKFDIIVTAENGSTKTYSVNVVVKDENPIETVIDGLTYTVVKRSSSLEAPQTYKLTSIEINGISVPAFKSDITNFVLVGLKSSNGTSGLYIYDSEYNTYTLYREIKTEGLVIFPTKVESIKEGYKEVTITINNEEVTAYAYEGIDDFYLVHGVNIQTGEEGYFEYDKVLNTFSRYNDTLINSLTETNKNYLMIIVVLGVETLIMLIIVLVILVKKGSKTKARGNDLSKIKDKPKKEKKKKREEIVKEEIKEENKEDSEVVEEKPKNIEDVKLTELKFKRNEEDIEKEEDKKDKE